MFLLRTRAEVVVARHCQSLLGGAPNLTGFLIDRFFSTPLAQLRTPALSGALVAASSPPHAPVMCGILCVVVRCENAEHIDGAKLRRSFARHLTKLENRGPDATASAWLNDGRVGLGHTRLAINGGVTSSESFEGSTPSSTCAITNGEIYNHEQLRQVLQLPTATNPCDTSVIVPLYDHYHCGRADIAGADVDMLLQLEGPFATIVYDGERSRVIAARDAIGINPLFVGTDSTGGGGLVWIASTMGALPDACDSVFEVPAGSYVSVCLRTGDFAQGAFFGAPWGISLPPPPPSHQWKDGDDGDPLFASAVVRIRAALERAVAKRLMVDDDRVQVGVLLSGGIDSSAIAALACSLPRMALGSLHSFCVGWRSSQSDKSTSDDLVAARVVAEHLQMQHHEAVFTSAEGIASLRSVITAVETYDVPTIRAAVPQHILLRLVRRHDVAVVLCGEGADEVFGGYARFARLRREDDVSRCAFHAECVRLVNGLYETELLRVDRITQSVGVEARVPFLDIPLVRTLLCDMDVRLRQRGPLLEKELLREAVRSLLPESIVLRPKKQFADGCGHGWLDDLHRHCNVAVSDSQLHAATTRFPVDTPTTKEAYLYREIFEQIFASSPTKRLCVHARHRRRREKRLLVQQYLTERCTHVSQDDLVSNSVDIDLASRQYRHDSMSMTKPMSRTPSRDGSANANDESYNVLATLVNAKAREHFLRLLLGDDVDSTTLPCTLHTLNILIRAHLAVMPFNNLTMLIRTRRPPTLAEILIDCQTCVGGPCAVMNTHFAAFLHALGFRARLAAASIQKPDCHFIIIVTVDSYEYFVDVANAHPYFEAIRVAFTGSGASGSCPVDTSERRGPGLYWRIVPFDVSSDKLDGAADPNEPRYAVMHRKVGSKKWTLAMHFNIVGRSWAWFQPMVRRSRSQVSFGPFLRSVRLIRFPVLPGGGDEMIAIKDRRLLRAQVGVANGLSGITERQIQSRSEMLSLAYKWFGSSSLSSRHEAAGVASLLPAALDVLVKAGNPIFEGAMSRL